METIDINEVFAQANVVENLKNFAGIDAQNALSMMTPERLAAVVGGNISPLRLMGNLQKDSDANKINRTGIYTIVESGVANIPSSASTYSRLFHFESSGKLQIIFGRMPELGISMYTRGYGGNGWERWVVVRGQVI